MPPRLAVGSVDFDHLGFDGFLRLVRDCDLAAVELYPASLGDLDPGGAAETLARYGVSVGCVNVTPRYGLGGGLDAAACRAETSRCIDLARRFGAPLVNTYIGPYEGGPEASQRRYLQEVQPLLEAAAAAGVTVLVENLADPRGEDPRAEGLGRSPETLRALSEAIGPAAPWGLTFDAANFRQAGYEGYPYAYRLLRPHIRHVHAKDSVRFSRALYGEPGDRRILRDSREGEFLGVAVGSGSANFDGLLAELRRDGYAGQIVIEPHVCAREAEAALRDSQAYIARRWGEG